MKKFFITSILILISLFAFSCNENSSISISQALATSQPKDGKRWKSAEIIFNSTDSKKVDAVAILANDGLYIVNKTISDSGDDYLATPTYKNKMKDDDGNVVIDGLIRNIYVPSNYDSASPKIIIQCVSTELDGENNFYSIDLSGDLDLNAVQKLTKDDSMDKFCSKSSVNSSQLIMLYKDKGNNEFTYSIGKYKINGTSLEFATELQFDSSTRFYNFFESDGISSTSGSMILTSAVGDDIKEQEYYLFNFNVSDPQETRLSKLHSLAIRNFVVYDDGKFQGFTQSGTVIHSESTSNYLYTSDSNYSYNRYSPVVVFRNTSKASDDEPDVTFFGKYTGNGYIIYSYNKDLSYNRAYNDKYHGSVQTQGYAENLRSEDISEMKGALVTKDGNTEYCILVLSSENGISTYTFTSILPNKMTYSDGIESRNKVDLF